MGRGSANPVVLSVVSNGERVTRKWKIKINMIPCNNLGKKKELGQHNPRTPLLSLAAPVLITIASLSVTSPRACRCNT